MPLPRINSQDNLPPEEGPHDEETTLLIADQPRVHRPAVWAVASIICIFTLFILTVTFAALYAHLLSDRTHIPQWPKPSFSPMGIYSKASVAADNEYCSEIGRNTLLHGGNAVDAAIAALFCIGVMDTHSAGIGGGHFMVVYNASTKECHVVDARETAPAAAFKDMYKDQWNQSQIGWKAVATPGEIHGLWTEFVKFGSGKVPWGKLIQPTIDLLEEGFPTSHALAKALREEEANILAEPTMKDWINPVTGKLYERGEQITTRTTFLNTLKRLQEAKDPVQLFYNGSMTEDFVKEFKERGGIITLDDFKNYRSIVYPPSQVITTHLRDDWVICGPPPPSGSAVAQSLISIMDAYTYNRRSIDDVERFYHHYLEASKFAYAWRSWLGDPKFIDNATEIAWNITRTSWAEHVRQKITDNAHQDEYYGGHFVNIDHGTTHISAIDAAGNAVAVTSTINLLMGAKVASPSTGIVWNDEMDDFSIPGHPNYFGFPPSPANFIQPGKRPMSSQSPLIIRNTKNGKIYALGGAGGSKIISSVAGSALHALKLGANIKQAIDSPRLHNQLEPNCTKHEGKFPLEYIHRLENRGHTFCQEDDIAVVTGVYKQMDGKIYANSDFRKGEESSPAGY